MAWQHDLTRIPLPRLVLGTALGWALTFGVGVWLIAMPGFDERARMDIVGEVQEVRTPLVLEQPVLDFAVVGQTVRFRADATVFREVLHGLRPPELQPGATARLTVEKLEYEKPFSPQPYNVPTVSVEAMQIEGSKLLTLEISRQLDKENRRWAKIVGSMAALCAAFLSWATIMRIKLRSDTR